MIWVMMMFLVKSEGEQGDIYILHGLSSTYLPRISLPAPNSSSPAVSNVRTAVQRAHLGPVMSPYAIWCPLDPAQKKNDKVTRSLGSAAYPIPSGVSICT